MSSITVQSLTFITFYGVWENCKVEVFVPCQLASQPNTDHYIYSHISYESKITAPSPPPPPANPPPPKKKPWEIFLVSTHTRPPHLSTNATKVASQTIWHPEGQSAFCSVLVANAKPMKFSEASGPHLNMASCTWLQSPRCYGYKRLSSNAQKDEH